MALLATVLWAGDARAQGRTQGRGRSAAALEAARRFLCPHGGTPRRGGRCAPPAAGGMGDDPEVIGWDRGIAPPTRTQRACPEGTGPDTTAQAGVVRCVPR